MVQDQNATCSGNIWEATELLTDRVPGYDKPRHGHAPTSVEVLELSVLAQGPLVRPKIANSISKWSMSSLLCSVGTLESLIVHLL